MKHLHGTIPFIFGQHGYSLPFTKELRDGAKYLKGKRLDKRLIFHINVLFLCFKLYLPIRLAIGQIQTNQTGVQLCSETPHYGLTVECSLTEQPLPTLEIGSSNP